MDQKIRTAGGYFVTYVCLCCGVGMLVFGILILEDPSKDARVIATLALISSALSLYGGITNFISTRKAATKASNELAYVQKLIAAPEIPQKLSSSSRKDNEDKPNILARWQYSANEWQEFMGREVKTRKSSSFIEALLIIIMGVIFLFSMKDASFIVSFLISVTIAVAYWLGKYFLSMKSFGNAGKTAHVVITDHSVIINGKFNSFKDDIYWLKDVNIANQSPTSFLSIEYGWRTRYGDTFEHIRIPIPPGKMDEAQAIRSKLMLLK